MRVLVLGAGVIGVSTAYYLAKRGYKVTVIESNKAPAQECSLANGGQLSFGHVEVWNSSLSLKSLFLALISRQDNKISYSEKSLYFLRWALSFLLNSTKSKSKKNSDKIYQIATLSRELFKKISAEEDIKCNFKEGGILHFYRTTKELEKAIDTAKYLGLLGKEVEVLDQEQCLAKEPRLKKLEQEEGLAGGLLYKNDFSGDCADFTAKLAKICCEKYNVTFEYGHEIQNILTNRKKITGINTSQKVFSADFYIYALGVGGLDLLKGIEVDPKIYPFKGYSISANVSRGGEAPNMALTDVKNRIVYSRIGSIFRAAGTVDITNLKPGINKNKVQFLKDVAQNSFNSCGDLEKAKEWFGFRPFRSNSLPLICNVKKYGNLFLNTGHGSLGWTLSLASGMILENTVSNNVPERFAFLNQEKLSQDS